MDDVVQILVFLVTLVVFIVSAIMKQNKKAKNQTSKLDNIVESIFGIPLESVSNAHTDTYTELKPDEHEIDSFTKAPETISEEGIDAIPDETENNDDSEKDEETVMPPFVLRQAIIYSEILNRKYY